MDFEAIEELGDLMDADVENDEAIGELGDLGAMSDTRRRRYALLQSRRKRIHTNFARKLGIRGLRPAIFRGLVPTIRPLYANYLLDTSTELTAGGTFSFYQKGIGDTGLGWGSTELTSRHTNVGNEGKLPNGEMFVVLGLGFEVSMLPGGTAGYMPTEVDPRDQFAINNCIVSYQEGQGTRNLVLGRVGDMPVRNFIDTQNLAVTRQITASTTSASMAYGVRQAGPLYLRRKPIAILRGGDKVEANRIVVTSPAAVTFSRIASTDTAQLSNNLYGIWWQHPAKVA